MTWKKDEIRYFDFDVKDTGGWKTFAFCSVHKYDDNLYFVDYFTCTWRPVTTKLTEKAISFNHESCQFDHYHVSEKELREILKGAVELDLKSANNRFSKFRKHLMGLSDLKGITKHKYVQGDLFSNT